MLPWLQKRNYMDEMYSLICAIERLTPEPEVCNVRCPPLGCPRGPCPGMCCYEQICDPCCMSQMPPCPPPPPHSPRCCMPKRDLQNFVRTLSCQPQCSSKNRFNMPVIPRTCSPSVPTCGNICSTSY